MGRVVSSALGLVRGAPDNGLSTSKPLGLVTPRALTQSWSCQPRRTCPQIGSCEEANWYLNNYSWGGKLDRDGDGIPCERLC
ncbi:excalibur calcium-binding domain-containing protein [Mesorhizobium sp. M00.F.Ca.ET.216.01.1.1]|nr:excalibur calcium-binding domain-containing protein [Mesorhizobium sp. M00.F.Ca.ET.216.01.1.1]TJW07022.1 MAG: excalibur calcium-binding domain-containing protein [Mesorhizobium sp.]TJW40018.1 MAG: excalibur calcium-binding domain-containing protein [Mesorhizobium sp.]